ncbi:unnamed protein product [Fraxinus pennsylvanica]|uniref:NAC domain-containing protein n=1 Tax=Fraxinus pennsylvanica TaxID=56036 RepID=A0AAD1YQN6_9LAMI|nr:unnamed protein product [Fraxinus pennsylvanica]
MAEVPRVDSRYQPTDSELLQCLLCKAHGKPFPAVDLVRERDLYSGVEPVGLFRETDNNVLYFFTKLEKKKKNKGHAGKGIWKGVTKTEVYSVNGKCRGYKKSYVYETVENGKIGYNMDEYSLDSSSLLHAKFKDNVLCRIEQKYQKHGKNRNLEDLNGEIRDIQKHTFSRPPRAGGSDSSVSILARAFTDQQVEVVLGLPAQISQQELPKFQQTSTGEYSLQNMDCDGSNYAEFAEIFARDLKTQNPQELKDEEVLQPNPWAVQMVGWLYQ